MSTGTARRILIQFCPAYVRRKKKAVTITAKSEWLTVGEAGKGQFLLKEYGKIENCESGGVCL